MNIIIRSSWYLTEAVNSKGLKGFYSKQVSWCKFEVIVDCPKDISASSLKNVPPVVAMAINLKTVIGKNTTHEIVSASLVCCHKTKVRTFLFSF